MAAPGSYCTLAAPLATWRARTNAYGKIDVGLADILTVSKIAYSIDSNSVAIGQGTTLLYRVILDKNCLFMIINFDSIT